MTDIQISDLTNSTSETFGEGTGAFDKLMQTVTLHIQEEYENGRVTGTDYATVYLGSFQTVLQQAVQFLLQEQEAGKRADLIDSQIRESEEKIDLIAAQTAKEYEAISASQARTVRENILNNKQVLKLQKETVLIERQIDKVTAETTDQLYITEFLRPQELAKITAETADQVYVTEFIRPKELEKIIGEIAVLASRDAEQIAGTVRSDAESVAKIANMTAETDDQLYVTLNLRPEEVDLLESRDAEQLAATTRNDNESTQKIALMAAQTLGFASDTKQKLLKIMHDGYAVNLSIAGVGDVPEANQDTAIDALVNELLNDIGSTVVISGEVTPPPL